MPAEKATALVLRVVEWSETSSIVTLLTREFGKVRGLAKGARRPKGPFESALDLLSSCQVVFLRKSSDALDLLTEAKLQRRFRPRCRRPVLPLRRLLRRRAAGRPDGRLRSASGAVRCRPADARGSLQRRYAGLLAGAAVRAGDAGGAGAHALAGGLRGVRPARWTAGDAWPSGCCQGACCAGSAGPASRKSSRSAGWHWRSSPSLPILGATAGGTRTRSRGVGRSAGLAEQLHFAPAGPSAGHACLSQSIRLKRPLQHSPVLFTPHPSALPLAAYHAPHFAGQVLTTP